MNCSETKNLIPHYSDNKLQPQEMQKVSLHVSVCSACRKELQAYQQMWELLGQYQVIAPEPGFVSRFWTRLLANESRWESILRKIKNIFVSPRLALQVTTICVVLTMLGLFIPRYYYQKSTVKMLSSLSDAEIEMVDDMELAQHFDVIENLDLYEDLDIIERIQG